MSVLFQIKAIIHGGDDCDYSLIFEPREKSDVVDVSIRDDKDESLLATIEILGEDLRTVLAGIK